MEAEACAQGPHQQQRQPYHPVRRRLHRQGRASGGAQPAKQLQQVTNPKNTVYSIKRPSTGPPPRPEVASEEKLIPYEITGGPEKGVRQGPRPRAIQDFTPSRSLPSSFKTSRRPPRTTLGREGGTARSIHTVPAYFNDAQPPRPPRTRAKIAFGLKVEHIINEPTARGPESYGMGQEEELKKIAVFDLGGGTFDYLHPRRRRRRLRSAPPPTATPIWAATTGNSAHHRLHRRRVPQEGRHRRPQGPHGPPAPQRKPLKSAKIELSHDAGDPPSTCPSSPPTRTAPSTSK